MKSKSVVLLVMALGCGLVAMVGVQQVLKGNNAPVKLVKVLVATAQVEPYTRLDETKVAFRDYAESAVPEGAVLTVADYENRALMSGAIPGEVILKGKLTEPGKFGASGIIPAGMRVFTITVNAEQVMSGMIQAGDRVDVAVNWKEMGTNKPKTKLVLECIEVFALDKQRAADETTTAKGTKIETLSVLVKPPQAQMLQLAKTMGTLSLTLRTPGDTASSGLALLTEDDFTESEASQGVVSNEPDEGGKLHEQLPVEEPAEPVVEPSRPVSPLPTLQADVTTELPPGVWVMEIFEGEAVRRLEIPLGSPLPNTTATQTIPPVPAATPAAVPTSPSA